MSKLSEFYSEKDNQTSTVDSALWVRSCTLETISPIEGKVTGEIPEWLNGSLIMNGPGTYRIGDQKLKHLFDGMALLQKFNISKQKITYQNKFIKSEAYVKGREQNRVIYGEFGTPPSLDTSRSFFSKLASFATKLDIATDNTFISLNPISGNFYAMTETPRIQKINPETLDTIEKVDLEKKLESVTYTAHPHIMQDGTCYNLGYSINASGANYNIVHFASDGDIYEGVKVIAKVPARHKLNPSYSHSFGMTENFFVIIETPLTMSVTSLIRSTVVSMPFTESLKWSNEENTRIILIDRVTGGLKHVYYADSFYFLYTINQYEDDDHVVLDICCYKDADIIEDTFVEKLLENDARNYQKFRSLPLRFVLPLKASEKGVNLVKLESSQATATLNDRKVFCFPELLSEVSCIFPNLNYFKSARVDYQFFYAVGMDFDENFGAIIKYDVKNKTKVVWREEKVFAWEPKFIPSPNSEDEDDGIILAGMSFSGVANKTGIIVLNAKDLEEIARCEFEDLSSAIPKPLHGWFIKSE